MMSKFLLLLCFTAVHVLGEDQRNSSSQASEVSSTVSSLNISQQHLETSSSSNKVTGVAPVLGSHTTSESKTTPGVIPTNQNSTQSDVVTPVYSTVVPLDTTTVLVHTTVESVEKVQHAATNSAILHAPRSTTKMASLTPGKWIVNGTDGICIMVQMSAVFNVSYMNTNQTTSFKVFDLPVNNGTVNATGTCGTLEQNLTLKWSWKSIINASMTMHFMKNESAKSYSLHHLDVVLPPTNFPDAEFNDTINLVHEESNVIVALSNSYRCLKQQTLHLKQKDANQTSGYLILSGLQFQAFKADNSTFFGLAKDCAFDTPDVVPIAVGCALAGLVIIVLIAYLIGRRRNQSRGYLSM